MTLKKSSDVMPIGPSTHGNWSAASRKPPPWSACASCSADRNTYGRAVAHAASARVSGDTPAPLPVARCMCMCVRGGGTRERERERWVRAWVCAHVECLSSGSTAHRPPAPSSKPAHMQTWVEHNTVAGLFQKAPCAHHGRAGWTGAWAHGRMGAWVPAKRLTWAAHASRARWKGSLRSSVACSVDAARPARVGWFAGGGSRCRSTRVAEVRVGGQLRARGSNSGDSDGQHDNT